VAARKRAASRSRQSGLVGRAVSAGKKALHEAESRMPPDMRRQLERSIKDGQKTLRTAIDQLQVQVRRTAKQADVDKALKRLEGLSKQVQKLAVDMAARGAARAKARPRPLRGLGILFRLRGDRTFCETARSNAHLVRRHGFQARRLRRELRGWLWIDAGVRSLRRQDHRRIRISGAGQQFQRERTTFSCRTGQSDVTRLRAL